ncbi:MAG: hypothetical protein HQK77_06750 [Desulfobacterales bacterium]|nr:hypothetical protein [Desulfobacterales bacterium]
MHHLVQEKAKTYLKHLKSGKMTSGSYLHKRLKDKDISQLSCDKFIEQLVQTKQPQIFAESSVYGNGSDWNQPELSILGDICIAIPVTVYDNGMHYRPKVHALPFNATLLYIPGALLRNDTANTPADWNEVVVNNQIDYDSYYSLYERRLLPLFIYLNAVAKSHHKQAFVTIPGIGCGQFAGKFRGQLGSLLKNVVFDFLNKNCNYFSSIKAVYYDPYQECPNERLEINGISLLIRPLTKGNESKPQLCEPQKYEEAKDDEFRECELFSFVAWDHVSWPGNDFYIGSRMTDDGVKSAATNSMTIMTDVQGDYNTTTNTYNPPKAYRNWKDVVINNRIEIQVKDNLIVLPS